MKDMVFGKVSDKIIVGLFLGAIFTIASSMALESYLVPLLVKPGAERVPYGNALSPIIFGSGVLGAVMGWMIDLNTKSQSSKAAAIGIVAGTLSLAVILTLWIGSGYPILDVSNLILFVPLTIVSTSVFIFAIALFLRTRLSK